MPHIVLQKNILEPHQVTCGFKMCFYQNIYLENYNTALNLTRYVGAKRIVTNSVNSDSAILEGLL